MKPTRRRFLATASAAGAVLAAPAVANRALAAETIKVASILDLSGGLDIYGTPMAETTRMAVAEINAAGGLLDRELELKTYDTQSSIQLYTQFATEAAAGEKVDVVHGGITSASREAIRPTLARFQTLYFYNTQYEGGVCDLNCFNTGSTPGQTVQKLIPHVMKKWGKKAYIVAADYNYGQITAQWMQKFVADNGGTTVDTEFFPLDVTNFGPTIKKIQAAAPDFVVSALVGGAHVSFYRQYAAAGMNSRVPIASTTFGVGNEHQLISAAEGNGMICSYSYFETIDSPANHAYLDRFDRFTEGNPPGLNELATRSYEGVMLWAEAVRKAGSTDRMAVIDALRSPVSYDGPSGRVTVDASTNHLSMNVYLAELENQSFRITDSFEAQQPTDTQLVCDLVDNPDQSTFKFENGLEAAGIDL